MGLFAANVKFYDNGASIADLFITILEDGSMLWEKRVVHKEYAKIYFKDITSVSFSNGGLIADAWFSVSTPGKTYYAKIPGETRGLETLAAGIEECRRIAAEKENEKANTNTKSISSADEIMKFKDLLDKGIITQEEFDAKKKQLLGL